MEKRKIREDNKKIYTFMYILIVIYSCVVAYVNIMNTKNLAVLYTLLGTTIFLLAFLIVFSIFKRKKYITLIENNPSYIIYYQSTYKKNHIFKIMICVLDLLCILSTIGMAIYYYGKMDFQRPYGTTGIFLMGAFGLYLLLILILDLYKLEGNERIEVTKSSLFSIFSYDKKLALGLIMIIISILNVLILSVTNIHFTVYWTDLLIFELISLFTTLLFITNLFISAKYYSHYSFKVIEDNSVNFIMQECIGKGTFASVYKIYIPSLDKVFALKRLDSTKEKNIERFKKEFNLLKSLEHKNLVSVYSFNEAKLEYIMDYVDYTIYDYLENNAIDQNMRLNLINQLLDGVEYLHKHNIRHGDLSIANVMIKVSPDNELTLKITDFGISNKGKPLAFAKTRTNTHPAIEDPTLRDVDELTEQNDIYNVGGLITYIFTGKSYVEQNDEPITKIIYKCLDTNLSNRYKSIDEIRIDINKGVNI